MTEQHLKTCNKTAKNSSYNKKQNRKGDNPTRFSSNIGTPTTWICKNAACRAVLSLDDSFCKRCSCCICHQFDDNKDPSLWLVCESEFDRRDCCGLSCHVECAFQHEKVGVVKLGQFMQLDGSYCCASCGKVSAILGCWKKQLAVAKDARRVDVLCYRIFLSYRLLEGTSRFKDLHEILSEAKMKLEDEVGPMNGESVKMARGIVSRLPIASQVQKLCSIAIEKADELLSDVTSGSSNSTVDTLPAACRFVFEEVGPTSLVIILIDIPTPLTDQIKGYKLWYSKTRHETFSVDPASVFPRENRRILIKKLQPCTEYSFRVVSYTDTGDLGHSEAKCFTKSVEVIKKDVPLVKKESNIDVKDPELGPPGGPNSGFRVRDLGRVLHRAWARGPLEGHCGADMDCCGGPPPKGPLQLDLNVVSVPDLNEDLTPPLDSSRDEDNEERGNGPDDDAASHGERGDGPGSWALARNGNGPSSSAENGRKRGSSAVEEAHDCDSTLINGSPLRAACGPGSLDGSFEYCVKVIRWLECEGHIKQEFRLKLLTWFSLRSTEQERRVVSTFIQTLMDDPKSLAGQLVDSFGEIVPSKRAKNSKLSSSAVILDKYF